MKYNDKILIVFLVVFTILSFSSTVIIIFEDLMPSMIYAKTYIPTKCQVLNHYIISETTNQECIELNDQIWWYDKLGENDFYLYIVKKEHHSSNNNNNNNSNNNSSSGSSGSSGSINNSIGSNSDTSGNLNSYLINSNSNSNSGSSISSNERKCYQGLYKVSYSLNNGDKIESNISGVWNINQKWVNQYLNVFPIEENSNCFYQSKNNYNVNWFGPAKYSIFSIVGISIGGGFTVFCLFLIYYFYRKFSRNNKMGYISVSPDGINFVY